LRLAGERFFLRLGVSDPRLVGFQIAAAEALVAAPPQRAATFERLSRLEGLRDERGERIRRLEADLVRARSYVSIAALAEATLVTADNRRHHVTTHVVDPVSERDVATELVPPTRSMTVPQTIERSARATTIVIWCGDAHVRGAALVLHALEDIGLPLVVVANGTIEGVETFARFVPVTQGAEALRDARVVVNVNNDDPADAIALAGLGLRLIVSSSSGAQEYLREAPIYRAWVARDIRPAVVAALGAPPPAVYPLPKALSDPAAISESGPRVELRMRVTLGEPPSSLTGDALAKQRYSAIVRDGELGDALYESTVASGAVIFPDYVSRLVEAAERSGAARTVAAALKLRDDGAYDLVADAFTLVRRAAARVPIARLETVLGFSA